MAWLNVARPLLRALCFGLYLEDVVNFKRYSFLIVTAVAICLKSAPAPQSASQSSEDLIVTTKHPVTVAGRIMKYTARAGRLPILDIVGSGSNVVTDALHFEGAIINLQALERERGLDLRIAMPRDGRIELRDLERLMDKKTKLIEVSLVAMYNGFQHDLKAVCGLAHAHGAYVYADIVQAAGATPIDVRASGVDFCACSSFKWLMGDFGAGFLYAREDLLPASGARNTATRLRADYARRDEIGPHPQVLGICREGTGCRGAGGGALFRFRTLHRAGTVTDPARRGRHRAERRRRAGSGWARRRTAFGDCQPARHSADKPLTLAATIACH